MEESEYEKFSSWKDSNYGGVAKMELMEIIDDHTALLRNKKGV